jgi:hypothetical protein
MRGSLVGVVLCLVAGAMGCRPDPPGVAGLPPDKGEPNPPDLERPTKTDVISQTTQARVDVLFVVDNSGSMADHQRSLAENFPSFVDYFVDSSLDWHIGVVSTDVDHGPDAGRLQEVAGLRWVDQDTPDPHGVFAQMAMIGTTGSSDESGRAAAMQALTDPKLSNANAGFYREDARLSVVFISDQNDSSGLEPSRNEFIDFLINLKQDPEEVSASAIVPQQGDACVFEGVGTDYTLVAQATGGLAYSICEEDWSVMLEQLGVASAGLRTEYFLTEIPLVESLEVTVVDGESTMWGALDGEGCAVTSCFTFQYNEVRNSVVLVDLVPGPLAEVQIHYALRDWIEDEPEDQ